ncbi:molybdopterin-dependent oxidoreductase [Luteibacter anthropi]|uniref:Molybdopterin-dependent oxidoreductase n=1 Tax=Luteibacter anthropi TaxID=564369 RepID=A0A7X5UAY5_9GAMM|nr:molybdopterin-dependent oxidoreductase [Luteibacter anthropi]NII07156.1 molybdopterin-dependent oxidoreductase [Luteibacter anthropi]URX62247.1 molybdopterin-dependent oxidoreductase [Luteibacter anthropi]
MKQRIVLGCALVAAIMLAPRAYAADSIRYIVPGKPPVTLDAAALAKLPHASAHVGAHGDTPSTWDGIALIDLLREQGAPVDKALRGAALAKFVRVTASDGYQVIFTLGELDADLGAEKVLLVNRRDGHPLDSMDGPFRIIVPVDVRPARWIHNVTTIELVDGSSRTSM